MKQLIRSKIEEIVAARIKTLRKKRGLTQKSLAKAAGLHRTYLAKIETDKKLPLLKTICALADVFEIEVAEFLIPKETHKRLSQKKKELIKVVRESTPGEINTYFKIVSALDKKR